MAGRPIKNATATERDPFEAWGNIPTETLAERQRLFKVLPEYGFKFTDYRSFETGICEAIATACRTANIDLYERKRLRQGELRRELDELLVFWTTAQERLSEIGPDAAALVAEVAAESPKVMPEPPQAKTEQDEKERLDEIEPNAVAPASEAAAESPGGVARQDDRSIWCWLEPPNMSNGNERVRWVGRIVQEYAAWINHARERAAPSKAGKSSDEIAHRIFDHLAEIWETYIGHRPTITTDPSTGERGGPFVKFCFELVPPIWEFRDLKVPNIGNFAHKAAKRARARV